MNYFVQLADFMNNVHDVSAQLSLKYIQNTSISEPRIKHDLTDTKTAWDTTWCNSWLTYLIKANYFIIRNKASTSLQSSKSQDFIYNRTDTVFRWMQQVVKTYAQQVARNVQLLSDMFIDIIFFFQLVFWIFASIYGAFLIQK